MRFFALAFTVCTALLSPRVADAQEACLIPRTMTVVGCPLCRTSSCMTDGECPMGSFCVAHPTMLGVRFCLSPEQQLCCSFDSDCPSLRGPPGSCDGSTNRCRPLLCGGALCDAGAPDVMVLRDAPREVLNVIDVLILGDSDPSMDAPPPPRDIGSEMRPPPLDRGSPTLDLLEPTDLLPTPTDVPTVSTDIPPVTTDIPPVSMDIPPVSMDIPPRADVLANLDGGVDSPPDAPGELRDNSGDAMNSQFMGSSLRDIRGAGGCSITHQARGDMSVMFVLAAVAAARRRRSISRERRGDREPRAHTPVSGHRTA